MSNPRPVGRGRARGRLRQDGSSPGVSPVGLREEIPVPKPVGDVKRSQKRPEVQLYVPRGRRLQEPSDTDNVVPESDSAPINDTSVCKDGGCLEREPGQDKSKPVGCPAEKPCGRARRIRPSQVYVPPGRRKEESCVNSPKASHSTRGFISEKYSEDNILSDNKQEISDLWDVDKSIVSMAASPTSPKHKITSGNSDQLGGEEDFSGKSDKSDEFMSIPSKSSSNKRTQNADHHIKDYSVPNLNPSIVQYEVSGQLVNNEVSFCPDNSDSIHDISCDNNVGILSSSSSDGLPTNDTSPPVKQEGEQTLMEQGKSSGINVQTNPLSYDLKKQVEGHISQVDLCNQSNGQMDNNSSPMDLSSQSVIQSLDQVEHCKQSVTESWDQIKDLSSEMDLSSQSVINSKDLNFGSNVEEKHDEERQDLENRIGISDDKSCQLEAMRLSEPSKEQESTVHDIIDDVSSHVDNQQSINLSSSQVNMEQVKQENLSSDHLSSQKNNGQTKLDVLNQDDKKPEAKQENLSSDSLSNSQVKTNDSADDERKVKVPRYDVTAAGNDSKVSSEKKTRKTGQKKAKSKTTCNIDEAAMEIISVVKIKDSDLHHSSKSEVDHMDDKGKKKGAKKKLVKVKKPRKTEDVGKQDVKVDTTDDSLVTGDRKGEKTSDHSEEEESWDKMFDDDGECLDPHALDELTEAVGNVKIKTPVINYLNYQPKEPDFDYEGMNHVIEIYDFSPELKTEDLLTAFSQFKTKGFDIKWVDDTHALGVFSSEIAAADALQFTHPLFKVGPLSQACRQSKVKAKRAVEFLQPYKPRPETTAVVARRMLTGALGLKTKASKEQRDKEREEKQKLKQAKEKKKKERQLKEDIWEGNYSSNVGSDT